MSTIETMICDCCGAKKDVTHSTRIGVPGDSPHLCQWVTVCGLDQSRENLIIQRYTKHYCGGCWQAASDTLKPHSQKARNA